MRSIENASFIHQPPSFPIPPLSCIPPPPTRTNEASPSSPRFISPKSVYYSLLLSRLVLYSYPGVDIPRIFDYPKTKRYIKTYQHPPTHPLSNHLSRSSNRCRCPPSLPPPAAGAPPPAAGAPLLRAPGSPVPAPPPPFCCPSPLGVAKGSPGCV